MNRVIYEIVLSLVTGVVSAYAYSRFESERQKRRWQQTKNYFDSKIGGGKYLANYEILTVLGINPADDDLDKSRGYKEIAEEVSEMDISDEQYQRLYRRFHLIIDDMERFRAQALSLPGFTSGDFHKADSTIQLLRDYVLTHHLCHPLENNPDARELLKKSIMKIYAKNEKDSLAYFFSRAGFPAKPGS